MDKRFWSIVGAIVVVGALGVAAGRWWGASSHVAPTTTTTSLQQPTSAMWPFVGSPTRFGDPVAAARSFAVDYLGFVDPRVSAFQPGDGRSGEVPVRASTTGPVTTILVRQVMSDDSWWVLGAACADVVVTSPVWNQPVATPVRVRGRSTAFEAVVNVDVRQDGTITPLTSTTVLGGSMGVMGPFSASIPFAHPTTRAGALVLRILSPKDGNVLTASALRISFSP